MHCIKENAQVSPGEDLVKPRHFLLRRFGTGENNQRVRKEVAVAQTAQEENWELKAPHELRAHRAPPRPLSVTRKQCR